MGIGPFFFTLRIYDTTSLLCAINIEWNDSYYRCPSSITNTMNMFLLQQLVRNIYCYNAQTEYFRTKFKFVHYQHQQPFLS